MIGTILAERYCLLNILGSGGFGKTYLAEDLLANHRLCVVKHLTPASQAPQFLQTARRLFENEATALRRLGEHDQIPALFNAFEDHAEFFLVQEYIEGHPLSRELKSGQPLPEAQVVALLEDALGVLDFIHSQQVIHRDIKPSNLMRRQGDGKLVLIDFGAVKEITTHIQTGSLEQFTVSIGTQGYAPAEQLAGRPRYSSDLYALGMMAIQALTGRSPTDLPEDPNTGELLWQAEVPEISPGLATFLHRLAHPSVYQRYGSAAEALQDLANLETLAYKAIADVPETSLMPAAPHPPWRGSAIAALMGAALVLLIRQGGGWMPLELMIYNTLVRHQPAPPPDPRLLVVEITEPDLQQLQRPTPEDQTLAQAIAILQQYQPRVIGLDMHRELPQGEGHDALLKALIAPNVINIRKIGDRPTEAIPAPEGVPPDQVGFNDFPVDPDGVIRRNLLFASVSNEPDSEVLYSFGLRLALAYLAPEGITPQASAVNPAYFQLGDVVFYPLTRNFGGYHGINDAGYQLLLRYRSGNQVARRITLGEVLAGQFPEDWVRDRIILIGTTAPSAKDLFYTPYSAAATEDHLMAGVLLHAQMTSQVLSAVLDGRSLPWAWSEVGETVWILGLALAGGALVWGVRRLLWLGLGLGSLSAIAIALPLVASLSGGWIPLASPTVAGMSGAGLVALYHTYQSRRKMDGEHTFLATPPLPLGKRF